MAKFLNKKEQVYDLRLTSYGRYLLGEGDFKPTYYAFFDDNILYDSDYARLNASGTALVSGSKEAQNDIHKRIKEETQYLESLVLFEDVESNTILASQTYNESEGYFNTEFNPTKADLRKDALVYEAMIGDAYFSGKTQAAPAWKIVTLQSEIASIVERPPESGIPQVNITAMYTKEVVSNTQAALVDPEDYGDSDMLLQNTFKDNEAIRLKMDHPVIYIEELNTALLKENFDVEIFQITDNSAEIASGSMLLTGSIPSNGDTVTVIDGLNTITFEFTSSVFGTGSSIPSGDPGAGTPMFTPAGIMHPTASNGNTLVERGCRGNSAAAYIQVTRCNPTYAGLDGAYKADYLDFYLEKAQDLLFQAITASVLNLEVAHGTLRCYAPEKCKELAGTDYPTDYIELYNKRYGVGGNQALSASNGSGSTAGIENWNGKIQLGGMGGGFDGNEIFQRKYFAEQTSQIQDGYMISEYPIVQNRQTLTTGNVDYYFDFLADGSVDERLACKGASIFNKESYYIDLDFECEATEENTTYYDIYGYVTEPEICLD
ncbi:MAG TPA: hypothetical protein EYN67_20950 [Flavobacteriales bacterium]|nr:hypothetical protein [Flavobacteriales bacterium]